MDISQILSQYVSHRDNFVKVRGSAFAVIDDGGARSKFSELIDGWAASLAFALPPLNLTEWEALAELVNSRLNYMRQVEQQGKRP